MLDRFIWSKISEEQFRRLGSCWADIFAGEDGFHWDKEAIVYRYNDEVIACYQDGFYWVKNSELEYLVDIDVDYWSYPEMEF